MYFVNWRPVSSGPMICVMMEIVGVFLVLFLQVQPGFSDDVTGLRITNKDYKFTASWNPLIQSADTSAEKISENEQILYTLYAIGLELEIETDDFAPVKGCSNLTTHSCVIDDSFESIRLSHHYHLKVNASRDEGEVIAESDKLDYIPREDRNISISPPDMNVTRSGRNITVYLETPRPELSYYDEPIFDIVAFGNSTDGNEYWHALKTTDQKMSWTTSAPDNVTMCVRARYVFKFEDVTGQWNRKCAEGIEKIPPSKYFDESGAKISFTTLVALLVIFGIIFLALFIVCSKKVWDKYYRNPFQDPDLTLPKDTVAATNVSEGDEIVLKVFVPEICDDIKYIRESNNEEDSETDNLILAAVFSTALQETDMTSSQEMHIIEIEPATGSKKMDITGRKRIESADSAFCDEVGNRLSRDAQNDRCSPLHESPKSQGSPESGCSEDEGYVRVPFNINSSTDIS